MIFLRYQNGFGITVSQRVLDPSCFPSARISVSCHFWNVSENPLLYPLSVRSNDGKPLRSKEARRGGGPISGQVATRPGRGVQPSRASPHRSADGGVCRRVIDAGTLPFRHCRLPASGRRAVPNKCKTDILLAGARNTLSRLCNRLQRDLPDRPTYGGAKQATIVRPFFICHGRWMKTFPLP